MLKSIMKKCLLLAVAAATGILSLRTNPQPAFAQLEPQFSSIRTITSGAIDSAFDNDRIVAWNSSASVPKTQHIPGCGGGLNGRIYQIKDEKGDAAGNPITIIPTTGTIDGNSSITLSIAYGSVNLGCDGNGSSTNWISVVNTRNSANLSSQLAFRYSNGTFNNSGGTGQTVSVLSNIEAPATWVRLIHYNDQTAATWQIVSAAVAPTAAFGVNSDDGYDPYDDNGIQNNGLWVPVTYSNNCTATSDQFSQATGSTLPVTISSPATYTGQPSACYSDWVKIVPVTRTDGGAGALLLTRIYSSGLIRYQSSSNYAPANVTRSYTGNWKSGNFATSNWTFSSPSGFFFGAPGIQYITQGKGVTLLGVGDSITSGNESSGSYTSYGVIAAAALSTPSIPIEYFQEGFSGRTSFDYMSNAYNDIKNLKPQVVVIQMWSRNDVSATSDALIAFNNGMALAQFAIANGAYPILTTASVPYCTDPTDEVVRTYSNALVRAVKGYSILDLDQIWGTGSSPNCYQTQYNGGDNVHPNDTGYAAAAAALETILKNYVLPH